MVTGSGTDSSTVLDGFTVMAGRADDDFYSVGGGMLNYGGSPTVANVIFSRNSAPVAGGGMYNTGSSSRLTNVTFSGNSVSDFGGDGGGMCNYASSPTLTNVTFSGNSSWDGGGMFNGTSSPTLTNVVFSKNFAGWDGGGGGGGMCNDYESAPTLINVTFSRNSAGSGGGMYNGNSTAILINTVFWGDSAATAGDEMRNDWSTPVISYSLIEGCGGSGLGWDTSLGTDGGHNTDADPLFVDAAAGNLQLSVGSPAVNSGDNTALPAGVTTDLAGKPRIWGGTIDMGAYEFQGCPPGPVVYVYQSATGGNDGSSWANAYTDLQSALGVASVGDSIWVAAATYKPTSGIDRTATFQLANGVVLCGGFAGTETMFSERDWASNVTILSGNIGAGADSTDNSYHVVTGSGRDSSTVLDGFTVMAGRADDDFYSVGGGMLNYGGSPTVANVIFSRNHAPGGGGGMYNENGSPTVTNVTFSGNSVFVFGGDGGGMCNYGGSPTLTNVTFSGNSSWDGGGMFDGHSSPTLTNVVFSKNFAGWEGGGGGGGMCNDYGSAPTLINVTFSENSAGSGGGMYNGNSTAILINTVFWGDSAATAGDEVCNAWSEPVISYSLIEGCGGSGAGWDASLGTDGGHNKDADPLFVDAAGGDPRLSSGYSPAVNAGNNAALPPGVTTDPDGNPRIVGETVDMGAYEFQVLTAIESENRPQPFRIVSVTPNPFNPSTTIRFTLPRAMPVTAWVWSVTGARVRLLAHKQQCDPGDNHIIWDGRNDHGSPVASGVYFIRIETSLGAKTTRAVPLK